MRSIPHARTVCARDAKGLAPLLGKEPSNSEPEAARPQRGGAQIAPIF